MKNTDSASKITARHLARKAVVYLRQSSIAQVRHNVESQRLQYALKDTAKAYGFAQVEVIDVDLGMSASSGAQVREGFKQLLASVALGEVGIVLSREPSRLSRTDKDWCHLMELCRVLDTLIGDADNIYDLNRLDDQLLLGIKGTLSVMELGTLKLRMQQGREAKARRGELGRMLAPGYVMDADQRNAQGSEPARAASHGDGVQQVRSTGQHPPDASLVPRRAHRAAGEQGGAWTLRAALAAADGELHQGCPEQSTVCRGVRLWAPTDQGDRQGR